MMKADFTSFLDELIKIGSVHWTNIDFVDETEKVAFGPIGTLAIGAGAASAEPLPQQRAMLIKRHRKKIEKLKKKDAKGYADKIKKLESKIEDHEWALPPSYKKKTANYLQVGDEVVKIGPIDAMRTKKLFRLGKKEMKLREQGRKLEADALAIKMRALNAKLPMSMLKPPNKAKTAAPMVPFEGDTQTAAKVKPLKKIKGKGRKDGIKKLVKSLGPGEGVNV